MTQKQLLTHDTETTIDTWHRNNDRHMAQKQQSTHDTETTTDTWYRNNNGHTTQKKQSIHHIETIIEQSTLLLDTYISKQSTYEFSGRETSDVPNTNFCHKSADPRLWQQFKKDPNTIKRTERRYLTKLVWFVTVCSEYATDQLCCLNVLIVFDQL